MGGHAAEELAYRLRQQELTAEFGLFAFRTHDLRVLLHEATRVCALGLQSRFCKVMRHLPAEGAFLLEAGVGWKPGFVGETRMPDDLGSPTGYAFRTGQPLISNHLSGESRFRTPHVLAAHGIRRAINVIIRGEGKPYGVLEVDSPGEGRFTEADVAFLQSFANLLGGAIDRQGVEQALRDSEARLQAALAHQEVLTREISHRVKNSLSIVASLLSMQGHAATDARIRAALEDAQTRVLTIATVHDRLWRGSEVGTLNLAEFMGDLCRQFSTSVGLPIALTCEVPDETIATDQAVALGLVTNELVTNARKYAHPDGAGEVRVSLRRGDRGRLRFELCDRGRGLPPGFDPETARGLGMKMIMGLARQLGSAPDWQDAEPGTRFVLEFPERGDAAREA